MLGKPTSFLRQFFLCVFHGGNLQRFLMQPRVRGGDETLEQRMRLVRLAQKFWMELARHKKWMIFQFDDFHEFAVR